jgi:hypothetical protein
VTHYAYGRRPAVHSLRASHSAMAMMVALDPLGPPPATCNDYVSAVKVPWDIYDNDKISDCVPCDEAHSLMLRTANVSNVIIPTLDDVISLYEAVGGYVSGNPDTDKGCAETDMCDYMVSTGFLGHKAAATGSVDYGNQDYLRWCIQLFGTCRLGLNLPGYAEDQFDAGQPWDVSSTGFQETNGHDVPLVWYGQGVFKCVTWGQLQTITPAFITKYCEEAHVLLFPDWIRVQGEAPSGFNLVDLTTKLQELAG